MQLLLSCACLGIVESLIVVVTMSGSWLISWIVQKLHHRKCCGKINK